MDVVIYFGLDIVVLPHMAVELDFHGAARYRRRETGKRLFWR
jgi:hypothetical protein